MKISAHWHRQSS